MSESQRDESDDDDDDGGDRREPLDPDNLILYAHCLGIEGDCRELRALLTRTLHVIPADNKRLLIDGLAQLGATLGIALDALRGLAAELDAIRHHHDHDHDDDRRVEQ